jgi:hypothetical protein
VVVSDELAPPGVHHRAVGAATWTFAAVEAVAAVIWIVQSRSRWFFADEWAFLVDGSLSPHDLVDDHNGHWSAIPLLLFRALWEVVGLHSYLPYVTLAVAAHLTAAALLFAVMRRAGVHPWITAVAASLFALFGAGYEGVMWAFQIAYSGALVLGLTALLLSDHDGPVDRRDGFALVAGLGSLLCSGVGVAMAGAVVLAALVRRGPRVAALYAGTFGAVYGVWWVAIGRDGAEGPGYVDANVGEIVRFVATGFTAAFGNIGQVPGLGLLLGALLLGGIVVVARSDRATRRRVATPVALAIGSLVFLAGAGYSRVGLLGPEYARTSRYQYVAVALLLPVLAVALDALARGRRVLVAVACVLLALGIPGNVAAIGDGADHRAADQDAFRHVLLAIPRTSVSAEVPRGVRPFSAGLYEQRITVGWLRDAAAAGELPDPGRVTRADRRTIRAALALVQSRAPDVPTRCPELVRPERRRLSPGDTIEFLTGRLVVTPVGVGRVAGDPVLGKAVFDAMEGRRVTAVLGPLDVVLRPKNPFAHPVRLCPES